MNFEAEDGKAELKFLNGLGGHTDRVRSVSWSPDGSLLASGSDDKTLCIWNDSTGELVRRLSGHSGYVLSVSWSPDGSLLVSSSDDKTICVWNNSTGELVRRLEGHSKSVRCVCWSPDGSLLASGSDDKTICIWNSSTGELVRRLEGHSYAVNSVNWSPDGSLLASGSFDMTLCIWNSLTGELVRRLERHSGYVNSVNWSPDGSLLASGSSDKTLCIWNSSTGELVRRLSGHSGYIWSVSWSLDGLLLASASYDKTICIWNSSTGELVRRLEGHSGYVWSVSWSLDGLLLASGSEDKTICIWNSSTGELVRRLEGHSGYVNSVSWSSDGLLLASGSEDKTICIWNGLTGELVHRLSGHSGYVNSVSWSLDGLLLASGSEDKTICIWNSSTGELVRRLARHYGYINSVSWSPNGLLLASASSDITLCIWNSSTGELVRRLEGHSGYVNSVSWSPDGLLLASGSSDKTICIWNSSTGELVRRLEGHSGYVNSVSWSPDGLLLASGSKDKTICIWNSSTGELVRRLEGHSGYVNSVSWSPDGYWIVSRSYDKKIGFWSMADPNEVGVGIFFSVGAITSDLALHPLFPIIAVSFANMSRIQLYESNPNILSTSIPLGTQYRNAKIVLVGDSGVGKSGLGLVLSGQSYKETDSTHGRRVWIFQNQEVLLENGLREQREALLWDLAGQPSYRLVHQLHLNEIAVALVIFDARSELDPFAGVRHWDRALRQASSMQGNAAIPMQKILVAARIDRGGIGVSRERIDKFIQDMGFSGYFETSAREGWSIEELTSAVQDAIAWDKFPKVTSTKLFQKIKDFLVAEKEAGYLLSTVEDLYRTYLKSAQAEDTRELKAQFETCIGRVESRDLIKCLSFGNLVLLQPELLDAYASALVNAAKEEPDGLGCIAEEEARLGRFKLSEDERLKDKEQEKLLLIATVESLLRHEIALRENADDGLHIVFPSHFTRENPDLPDPEGKAVIFTFEGPVVNIYATLAVRLSHSGLFKKRDMWKNAATFDASVGGECGLFLREIEEGLGELILFFKPEASEQTRYQFEDYIYAHLRRRALPETVKRRRVFICPECQTPVSDVAATRRKERGFNFMACNVCDTNISLFDREERLAIQLMSDVQKMDDAADKQRNRETAVSIVEGKLATKDYDVFLCHNSKDKTEVIKIGEQLKEQGILPWLDIWELRPGLPWQYTLDKVIKKIKSGAVFIGEDGIGPWQNLEQAAFLRQFVSRECPVIPTILHNAPQKPELPTFLEGMMWVDFRKPDDDPLSQLIWGITGENPHHGKFKR